MVARAPLWLKDHWLALEILDHDLQMAIIKQVANRKSPAYLGNLNRRTRKLAYIAKRTIVLVEIKELRLAKPGANILGVHLRIHMPVGKNQVGPSIVVQVEEGVSPSNVGSGAAGDARFIGDIG